MLNIYQPLLLHAATYKNTKKMFRMKKTIFYSFAVCAMVSVFACQSPSSNNGKNVDSTGINEAPPNNSDKTRDVNNMPDSSRTGQMAQTTVDDKTHSFMNDAAVGGMTEVEASKLATERAMNPRVKMFAEMMVRDHSAANDELKTIARGKNVNLPAELGGKNQDHVTDLTKKKGADFDKAYMKMMESDHKDVVDAFEKFSKNGTDPDIKTFASQKLPTLRMHLDSAKAINKSLK
jgi:putative membrane protein